MKKTSINYKALWERVQILERRPECKGHDWEIDGKVYFVPDSISNEVYCLATIEQLLMLLNEDGYNDNDGVVWAWLENEIRKRVSRKDDNQ